MARPLPIPLLALALLAACCSAESAPPAPAVPGRTFAERLPSLPVENAARMEEGLYRGAQPDGAGLKALRELGVKTIVNLRRHHSDRREAEALGFRVVEIPLEAALESEPPTDADVKRFFDAVLDPGLRPVYFHCAHGKDRTGTMAALYRIEVDGWTPDEAVAEMRRFGYHEYYKDFVAFVLAYRPRGFRPPAPK